MIYFADEFNPDQTQTNPFNPIRYEQIGMWIDRLSPDAVTNLGWQHSTDEIWNAVNQAYSLYEERPRAEEIQ